MCQTFLLRISRRTLNLIIIVVQPSDVCTRELCNFSSWTTNSAANVENSVSVFDADLRGQVVFVTGNGLVEGLGVCEAAEVERLAPTVFVKVGAQIIVTIAISNLRDLERI